MCAAGGRGARLQRSSDARPLLPVLSGLVRSGAVPSRVHEDSVELPCTVGTTRLTLGQLYGYFCRLRTFAILIVMTILAALLFLGVGCLMNYM